MLVVLFLNKRDLTDRERALLEWLIQNGTGNTSELLAQPAQARVVSRGARLEACVLELPLTGASGRP